MLALVVQSNALFRILRVRTEGNWDVFPLELFEIPRFA